MRERILEALGGVAADQRCRVPYACESGSRAWGFASPDSDWDVRFLYVHRVDWYLRLEKASDTIDRMLPGDLDVSGWELRKALRLFAGCNLALFEWLGSPEVYLAEPWFLDRLRALIPRYFNPRKGMYHYLRAAESTAETHLGTGAEPVNAKKLFYVLRPLLACEWIQARQTMPPTEFAGALEDAELSAALRDEIVELREAKIRGSERARVTVSPSLHAWIRLRLGESGKWADDAPAGAERDWGPLNELLTAAIFQG